MKIVILDGYTENPGDLSWDGFAMLGTLTLYDRTAESAVVSRIGDAEIVYTNKTPITAKTLAACPNLRYIGLLATGYNVVDVTAAKAHGITVTNIPSYGTAAVAQFAFRKNAQYFSNNFHHITVKIRLYSTHPAYWFVLGISLSSNQPSLSQPLSHQGISELSSMFE